MSSHSSAGVLDPTEQEAEEAARGIATGNRHGIVGLWEADEHRYLGNNATLTFDTGPVPAGSVKLYAGASDMGGQDPKYLTYGELVSLGGDFYGVPAAPICLAADPNAAFEKAYATLADAANTEVAAILAIMDQEHAAVQQAIKDGKSPSSAYNKLGDQLSYAWNKATGGKTGIDPNGRYLALAAVNFDHFGQDAVIAYSAGHQWALTIAAGIKASNRNPAQKIAALQYSYAVNAFADHFLSDLFSAGHMRTPRRALYDHTTPAVIGSLLARCMHDEDSKYGLIVHNARGDTWTAYGDKKLLDAVNKDDLAMVTQAIQASVNDVWNAYSSQTVPAQSAWGALPILPDLARVQDYSTKENFSPLFIEKSGTTAVRTSRSDRQRYDWTRAYVPVAILTELKALGWLKGPPEVSLD